MSNNPIQFLPGDLDRGLLDGYRLSDAGKIIEIYNEAGDVSCRVRRADGSQAIAYGGPVYRTKSFMQEVGGRYGHLSREERAVADAMAKRAGWF